MARNKHTSNVIVKSVTSIPRPPIPAKVSPTKSYIGLTDSNGCKYGYRPKAQPPHSKHVVLYPSSHTHLDEELPIQNGNRELNGASPLLMIAAAYHELRSMQDPTLLVGLEHISKGLDVLIRMEDMKSELGIKA